jgi:hypothetical protein
MEKRRTGHRWALGVYNPAKTNVRVYKTIEYSIIGTFFLRDIIFYHRRDVEGGRGE